MSYVPSLRARHLYAYPRATGVVRPLSEVIAFVGTQRAASWRGLSSRRQQPWYHYHSISLGHVCILAYYLGALYEHKRFEFGRWRIID